MTTKFRDGPAAGVRMILRRAPLYLRVVLDPAGKFDALDQLDDTPTAGETVWAYRRVSYDGCGMIDWTEKGRRRGSSFQAGTYALIEPQPPGEVLRDKARWREWVLADRAARRAKGGQADA